MRLSLHSYEYSDAVGIKLETGEGENTQIFSSSLKYFLKIVDRLKMLPEGNPMNDFVSVSVDLAKKTVCFSPTRFNIGDPPETYESVEFTLREFMMIPDEDLMNFTYLKLIREYKQSVFPTGEILTLAEAVKRIPWITRVDYYVVSGLTRKVLYFTADQVGKDQLSTAIIHAQRRHELQDAHLYDSGGIELACIDSGEIYPTSAGYEKCEDTYPYKDTHFLVMRDHFSSEDVVIYQFRVIE